MFTASGTAKAEIRVLASPGAEGEVVVNDDSRAQNFRVESDSDANALLVDGAGNAVKLGTAESSTRTYQNAPNSSPADGNIGKTQFTFHLDQTNNALKVRVRYSDRTYKTGSISVS